MNVLKKLFISTNGESSNELSRKQWFHVYLEHVTILIAITLSIYTHHQVSYNSLIAVKFSIESQILTSVVHMLLLDCDEIEYFINGILARRGLKISPKNSKTFNPSIILTWTKRNIPPSLREKRIDHTGYSKKRSGFWPPSFFFLLIIFHVYLLEWLASKVECNLCLLSCDFRVRGTSYGLPTDRSRCSDHQEWTEMTMTH